MQTLPVRVCDGGIPPFLFFAEIAEVYRVFRLAFLTVDHFVPAYIGEHFLNEVAAKRAVDVSHRKSDCFSL